VGEFQSAQNIEYTPMMMTLPAEMSDAPDDVSGLSVVSETGETVPLLSLLEVTHEERPSNIFFEDVTKLSYVTAEVEDKPIVYVVAGIMSDLIQGRVAGYEVTDWNLFSLTLVTDSGEEVLLTWGGEWEMTLENFRDLGIAMGIALFAVYTILVAQYNRFAIPAYILVTVPLALIGILFGFLVLDTFFGIYLTATALIGFIALIGIVVNNAIIFLEYFDQAMGRGLALREALVSAGEARLRPILLTSLTTVLGSLTIVSDPVWSGLAWSIVFGLSLSTVLTLVVYPLLLVYFMGDKETVIN
jgi:multidrug efflux pump subunit AcrB